MVGVRPRRAVSATVPAAPSVRFDDSASSNATFLEVRAPDSFGLLHRVTKAMADLGLDQMWSARPAIARWYELIRAHQAYTPTYYFGSLLTERFPHLQLRKQAIQK